MSSEAPQVFNNTKKRKMSMSVDQELAEKEEDLRLCEEQLALVKAKLEIVQAQLALMRKANCKEKPVTAETPV